MGNRRRSGKSRSAQTTKTKRAPQPPPPKKRRWQSIGRLASKKALVLVGLVLTVSITAAVTALINADFLPWYHAATGQVPLAAQAFEQWNVGDTVERVIPPGESSDLKELIPSGTVTAAHSMGIAVDTLSAQLVVQAEDTTVTIIGIKLIARHVKPITNGTLLFAATQGTGHAIQLFFDADSADAVGKDSDGYDYFADSYVTLQPGEATEFDLQVTANSYYSQFWFAITIFADGHLWTVPVKDGSKLFQIAPLNGQYSVVYTIPVTSASRQWVREEPTVFCRQNPGLCT
jgi:hypothetical protein